VADHTTAVILTLLLLTGLQVDQEEARQGRGQRVLAVVAALLHKVLRGVMFPVLMVLEGRVAVVLAPQLLTQPLIILLLEVQEHLLLFQGQQ